MNARLNEKRKKKNHLVIKDREGSRSVPLPLQEQLESASLLGAVGEEEN